MSRVLAYKTSALELVWDPISVTFVSSVHDFCWKFPNKKRRNCHIKVSLFIQKFLKWNLGCNRPMDYALCLVCVSPLLGSFVTCWSIKKCKGFRVWQSTGFVVILQPQSRSIFKAFFLFVETAVAVLTRLSWGSQPFRRLRGKTIAAVLLCDGYNTPKTTFALS